MLRVIVNVAEDQQSAIPDDLTVSARQDAWIIARSGTQRARSVNALRFCFRRSPQYSKRAGLWLPTAALTGEGPKPCLPRVPAVDNCSVGDDIVQRATIMPQQDA